MTTKSRPTRFPVGVVVAAAIALTFMIIWSAVHWSQMAPTIVTREAGGNHGASIVSRGFITADDQPLGAPEVLLPHRHTVAPLRP